MRKIIYALTAASMAVLAQPAFANIITPGQSGIAPDVFTTPLGSSLVSTGSGTLSDGASYTNYVYKGNSFGADDLTFVLVVNPGDSHPNISQISYGSFAGLTTLDVGYCSTPGCGLGQLGAPNAVAWDGTTVTFSFSSTLNASGNTDFLEIQTNATAYAKTADICLAGTKTSCGTGFDPAAVPEPASLALLGTVLLGFGWRRRRAVPNNAA